MLNMNMLFYGHHCLDCMSSIAPLTVDFDMFNMFKLTLKYTEAHNKHYCILNIEL